MVNWSLIVTMSRIALIPLFILTLYLPIDSKDIISATTFFIIALTDMLDGKLARKRKEVSDVGAALDPLADKLLVSAALVFLIGRGIDAWMAYVIIAREFIVTGLRLIAPSILHARMLGKLKTIMQVIGITAVLAHLQYSYWIMLFATIITIVSGLHYLWLAREAVRLQDQ